MPQHGKILGWLRSSHTSVSRINAYVRHTAAVSTSQNTKLKTTVPVEPYNDRDQCIFAVSLKRPLVRVVRLRKYRHRLHKIQRHARRVSPHLLITQKAQYCKLEGAQVGCDMICDKGSRRAQAAAGWLSV